MTTSFSFLGGGSFEFAELKSMSSAGFALPSSKKEDDFDIVQFASGQTPTRPSNDATEMFTRQPTMTMAA